MYSLGIYYNVSNWYRLTDRPDTVLYSAVIGVALTIVFNLILVPKYSYIGTALGYADLLRRYDHRHVCVREGYYPIPMNWVK
ncbi:MAG: polysaccharide biosynthesis C-terminal domain-containing protein [Saprospiraceae bacterium]|nr:polysaccharide biosynthesis C-terminal domain-containing protein [Saprospiraceae bacterium]